VREIGGGFTFDKKKKSRMGDRRCAVAIVVLLILQAALLVKAQPSVFFVTTTGSDSNPCSVNDPCLTLQRALSVAEAGNATIFVGSGTYSGSGNVDITIALTNLTIIGAAGVVFSGGTTFQGWTLSGVGIHVENISFVEFYTQGSTGTSMAL
jgi:hypothetical protein